MSDLLKHFKAFTHDCASSWFFYNEHSDIVPAFGKQIDISMTLFDEMRQRKRFYEYTLKQFIELRDRFMLTPNVSAHQISINENDLTDDDKRHLEKPSWANYVNTLCEYIPKLYDSIYDKLIVTNITTNQELMALPVYCFDLLKIESFVNLIQENVVAIEQLITLDHLSSSCAYFMLQDPLINSLIANGRMDIKLLPLSNYNACSALGNKIIRFFIKNGVTFIRCGSQGYI